MYIVSHTKGLARYFTSFFLQTITSSKHHFLNFFCVSGTHWGLAPSLHSRFPFPHSIGFLQLLYYLLQHGPFTPIQLPRAPHDKPSHRPTNGCTGRGLKCNLG